MFRKRRGIDIDWIRRAILDEGCYGKGDSQLLVVGWHVEADLQEEWQKGRQGESVSYNLGGGQWTYKWRRHDIWEDGPIWWWRPLKKLDHQKLPPGLQTVP